jgi:hypothetical protein
VEEFTTKFDPQQEITVMPMPDKHAIRFSRRNAPFQTITAFFVVWIEMKPKEVSGYRVTG